MDGQKAQVNSEHQKNVTGGIQPGSAPLPEQPLFSFGIIADVQYADVDDQEKIGQMRYYRNSLKQVEKAVHQWNSETENVSFVIQMGDLIDLFNIRSKMSHEALDRTLSSFKDLKVPVYNTIGNHELYNFPRAEVKTLISFPDNSCRTDLCCYSFKPYKGFKFIVLDTYGLGMPGYPETDPNYVRAKSMIVQGNPNPDMTSWEGLEGVKQRYRWCNGGIDQSQLEWLEHEIIMAKTSGEKVILFGHTPLQPGSCQNFNLSLNYDETLKTLDKHDNVGYYFAGHNHEDAHVFDDHGIHHVTIPGVILAPPSSSAFGIIRVFPDNLEIVGHGTVTNRILSWRKA